MKTNYSVLMSVYYKEKPEFLKQAMDSMFNQTVPTNDFVLVCDGPLTVELDKIIEIEKNEHKDILNVIRLERNCGLGIALNVGLLVCKNDIVARMDSDDISRLDRCEKQIAEIIKGYSIVSGSICEFDNNKIRRERKLKKTNSEIVKYSKRRNPFNHMAVMFIKKDVIKAGNYSEKYHLFEDYYLWIRMFLNNCKAYNIDDILCDVRISNDMYVRRGGYKYVIDMFRFHGWMLKINWSSLKDFIFFVIPHCVLCIMPVSVRKKVYSILRKSN